LLFFVLFCAVIIIGSPPTTQEGIT